MLREATVVKDADQIVIMGHSSKAHMNRIVSGDDKFISVDHLVNVLKKAKELRGNQASEFNISLVACSGINVGRTLITRMQNAGLYGQKIKSIFESERNKSSNHKL